MDKKKIAAFVVAAIFCLTIACLIGLENHSDHKENSEPAISNTDIHGLRDEKVLDLLELPADVATMARSVDTDKELDSLLRSYFGNRPPLQGLPSLASKEAHMQIAEALLSGKLLLKPNPPFDVTFPLDWQMRGNGANWRSQFHSLRYVQSLVTVYQENGEGAYIDLADQIVFDWIEKNPIDQPPSDRSWHEGNSARRLLTLIQYWETYRKRSSSNSGSLARLLLSIRQHAEMLTDPMVYRPAGNHGIRQDWAVLAVALAIPEFLDSEGWRSTAIQRLIEHQLKMCFTDEGVQIENSPSYHFYTMEQLQNICNLFETNGFVAPLELTKAIKKMNAFAGHILLPNGEIPPLGDSDEMLPNDYSATRLDFLYITNPGFNATEPHQHDGLFPRSGYAIFRDTWGNQDIPATSATYVNFHATYHIPHPFRHKHDDELSFILYGLGRPWIVDFGKYSYTRSHTFRQFSRTVAAHNAYGALDLSYPKRRNRRVEKKVWMEPIFSNPTVAAARAHNMRFPGVKITRILAFLRVERTIILLDEISSGESHQWQGLLHLAPDLEPKVEGLRATCHAPDMPWILDVLTDSTSTSKLEVVKGQENPIQGWVFPKWEEAVPAPALVYSRSGKQLKVVTVLRIRPNDSPRIENLRLETGGSLFTVRYETGSDEHAVHVSRDTPLTVEYEILND